MHAIERVREWFDGAPAWKRFTYPFLITFGAMTLVLSLGVKVPGWSYDASYDPVVDATFSQTSTTDVCGGTGCSDPKQTRPSSPEGFVANFDANAYGHTRGAIGYSTAFHDWWIQAQKDAAAASGNVPTCVSNSTTGGTYQCTWDKFTAHDTCIVGSLPDTFTTNSCTFNGSTIDWASKIASPYWTKRGDLQTKWEARLIVCGTVGLIALSKVGTSTLGWLGAGSGMCLANKVTP